MVVNKPKGHISGTIPQNTKQLQCSRFHGGKRRRVLKATRSSALEEGQEAKVAIEYIWKSTGGFNRINMYSTCTKKKTKRFARGESRISFDMLKSLHRV